MYLPFLRSICRYKDKLIFNLEGLPSMLNPLGYGTPKIQFLSKASIKAKKNASRTVEATQAKALKARPMKKSKNKRVRRCTAV